MVNVQPIEPNPPADDYFPRRLQLMNGKEQGSIIDDMALLSIDGPKVLLGEPGMGKSTLMDELARQLDTTSITALRLINAQNPMKFMISGKPLLIDGLDEAMSRREGDAVDRVLERLDDIGSVNFILSCRVRDWQERTAINLKRICKTTPTLFKIEALSQAEARKFLQARFVNFDADHVLDHLNNHGLGDLYGNPLTLGLMGQVAGHTTQLPGTRAELFKRVCDLIWQEHGPDHQNSAITFLSKESALSAAGAIMAGSLLAGAGTIIQTGTALQEGDIRLADLQTLPGAEAARTIIASKLFHNVDVDRVRPVHRVIAEYLGARWLAGQARDRRAQRRLLAQLHNGGAVPASLRGLHAWLAFHSLTLSKTIIQADPFGVLLYGDTASLTNEQADHLFESLKNFSETDPYFRHRDRGGHSAASLMHPSLLPKIKAVIESVASNSHLRSLLIEGLENTPLACNLGDTLEAIVLSTDRFYHERRAATNALLPHRDRSWWQKTVAALHDQSTEDSVRLAQHVIEIIDCDVPDDLLASTLLAEIGVTLCPYPKEKKTRVIPYFEGIISALPVERIPNILDLLCYHARLLEEHNWEAKTDLSELVTSLLIRAFDEGHLTIEDSSRLWQWLGVTRDAYNYNQERAERLRTRLDGRDDLRRATQRYGLYEAPPQPHVGRLRYELGLRMIDFSGRSADAAYFLKELEGADNTDPTLRQRWCDMMSLAVTQDGFSSDVRDASRLFQADDQELEAFVYQLENPAIPAWQEEENQRVAQRKAERAQAKIDRCNLYQRHRDELRAGDLKFVFDPSRVYLGLAHGKNGDTTPRERLVALLNDELATDATAGFEAVLHRGDIPTAKDVSDSFAQQTRWNYCFAILAGMLARLRAGRGFSDLPADLQATGLLLCYDGLFTNDVDDLPLLQESLESLVIPTAAARQQFARLWIEPGLVAKNKHVSGLYTLTHNDVWRETATALVPEWLTTYQNLPETVELELVDFLVQSGDHSTLANLVNTPTRVTWESEERRLVWLAIKFIVNFDDAQTDFVGIGTRHPEFIWHLRNRLQFERGCAMPQVSVQQAKWIISEFRTQWAYATLIGSGSGNTNPYDATDFLRAMITRLSDDTSVEASEAMQTLSAEPPDTYSDFIRHMSAEQRQKRAEETFSPLLPTALHGLLTQGPPTNPEDLKSIVLDEIAIIQRQLLGDDLDQAQIFWTDTGIPYDENNCRDRLTLILSPVLGHYRIQRITEADMPKSKRADLAFAYGQLQLPMEVKGQWHSEVWTAASTQLDASYLIDWRSEQRGIYCVLWFGDVPAKSGRRLTVPPDGQQVPQSPEEMRTMLIERIPASRRSFIDVVVLDLSAGRPKKKPVRSIEKQKRQHGQPKKC